MHSLKSERVGVVCFLQRPNQQSLMRIVTQEVQRQSSRMCLDGEGKKSEQRRRLFSVNNSPRGAR